MDSLAAVNWAAYEAEALDAIAAAAGEHELESVRVRFAAFVTATPACS